MKAAYFTIMFLLLGCGLAIRLRKKAKSSTPYDKSKITISTYFFQYLKANDDGSTIQLVDTPDSNTYWELHLQPDGTFCIKSVLGTYLSSTSTGTIGQSSSCGEGEEWTFTRYFTEEDGGYRINNRFGKYLLGNPYTGKPYTGKPSLDSYRKDWLHWTFSIKAEKASWKYIQNANGLYLGTKSATDPDTPIVKAFNKVDSIWVLIKQPNGRYCIRNHATGEYLGARPEKTTDQVPWCDFWEYWTLEFTDGNMFYLKSYFGTYLSFATDSTAILKDQPDATTKWKFVEVPMYK
eukprot:TRINITY_DN940_c0_g1_i2.p1 TRINITY_DN940_c0_g1~~TRINITY_DN940_c0_g1_i2.p1  ORF type:complete len:292 (-),score=11.97 TRINITY_DN940_c0_g1_i2:208-1083(-)